MFKAKAIQLFGNSLFGDDENGMSIFDRITGVVKRQQKKGFTDEDLRTECIEEISNMEEFSLDDDMMLLGIQLSVVLLREE